MKKNKDVDICLTIINEYAELNDIEENALRSTLDFFRNLTDKLSKELKELK